MSDDNFSAVDRYHFIRLFRPRIYYEEGKEPRKVLKPIYPSPYGLKDRNPPLFRLYTRAKDLQAAFLRLREKDSAFAESFAVASEEVLARISERTTEREGRILVYPHFLSKGIYARILEEAGPSDFKELPAIAGNPWGDHDRPFARGTAVSRVKPRFPQSILMFHYCSGIRSVTSSGLTLSADEDDPFAVAHRRLRATDDEYRRIFDEITGEYAERALALDPFDLAGGDTLTRDWRQALVDAGIARRIEQAASTMPPNGS